MLSKVLLIILFKTSRQLLEKQESGMNNFEKTSQCRKIGLLRTVNYVMKSYRCYDKSDSTYITVHALFSGPCKITRLQNFPEVCDHKFIDYHALMT